MAYTDYSGKVITSAFGAVKVPVFATVVAGDLLAYDSVSHGFKLADQSEAAAAQLVAVGAGASGDTIDAAAAAVFEITPAESAGEFADVNICAAADVGASLYLGESGKAQSAAGAACPQVVGALLSRTAALLIPQTYLTGASQTLSGTLSVGGATTLSDDVTVGAGKKVAGAGTGASGLVLGNLKNAAASALSGTQRDVEIDIGGTPYYFTVYPTKA